MSRGQPPSPERSALVGRIEDLEHLALREVVRRFPTCGNQLEAAARTAYRLGIRDAVRLLTAPSAKGKS
ncbi:hypothetical protein [Sphingomonas hengshuiensis]|uniref:hypothetical protein n=1 Tax=Sphingomonas hengshuiensis TaxID=1609977 RepID=UPI0012B7F9CB|nr:hypothetical protein [Sphingomonas hengshuiensis]